MAFLRILTFYKNRIYTKFVVDGYHGNGFKILPFSAVPNLYMIGLVMKMTHQDGSGIVKAKLYFEKTQTQNFQI